MVSVPLTEGQTIAGKYQLVHRLGEGGMCIVYEAEHVTLRQGLAVKVLRPELADDADCVARFEREARAAAQLRSVNVAKVFDVDYLPGGQPYITMELLVGHDLGQELHDSGRLPIELAVDYVRQACRGIAEAHALGIVHRDMKPENLFLTELGQLTDRKLLKILDFGIAKNISDSARRLTAPDAVFGTVDYMSPEQIRSASQVDHRSDLWALGVILYELLTGETPYRGDARSVIAQIIADPVKPPSVLVPDLPPSLVATVMRALAKDPDQRFQSADDFREALRGYGEFEEITSVLARLPPESVPRRQVRTSASLKSVLGSGNDVTRDARTHGSWETRSERHTKKRGRGWLVVPLLGVLLGSGAGFLYMHGGGKLPWLTRTPSASAGSGAGSSATAEAANASALPIEAPIPASATTPAPLASDTPAPSASSSSSSASSITPADAESSVLAKTPRPRHPPPARSPAAPPPPPTTPQNRLPKHL